MGPKGTLFYHLNINLGHTNNKYGGNKVALLHKDIYDLGVHGDLGWLDSSLHMSWLNPKFKIMSNGMFLEGK